MKHRKRRAHDQAHHGRKGPSASRPAGGRLFPPGTLKPLLTVGGIVVLGLVVLVWLSVAPPRPYEAVARKDSARRGDARGGESGGELAAPRTGTEPAASARTLGPAGASALAGVTNVGTNAMGQGVDYLNLATEFLRSNKVDGAIALYEQALKFNPEDEDVHYNLGIAYAKQGNAPKAIEHYEHALRIVPDYAEAHNNLGNLLAQQRRFEEANEHFQAALNVMPDYASAHNNFGTALRMQGRIEDALGHYEEAVRLSPVHAEARFNLGNLYLGAGRVLEAMAQFNEVSRLRPELQAMVNEALERARNAPASTPAPAPTPAAESGTAKPQGP